MKNDVVDMQFKEGRNKPGKPTFTIVNYKAVYTWHYTRSVRNVNLSCNGFHHIAAFEGMIPANSLAKQGASEGQLDKSTA